MRTRTQVCLVLTLAAVLFGLPGLPLGVHPIADAQAATLGTERVSVSSTGAESNAASSTALGIPVLAADARYVVFQSFADNLVPNDANGVMDVFVRDRVAGSTALVSVSSSGAQANDESHSASISEDGRYVAFVSFASNLVPGDTNGVKDLFVRDLVEATTSRVSVDSSGGQANAPISSAPQISDDGRFVVFDTVATNLVPDDTNQYVDVFVHDRVSGQTTRVSVDSSADQAQGESEYPSLSADGQYVAFRSTAWNLVPDDGNGQADVFVHDRVTGTTSRVSVSSSGEEATGPSWTSSLSDDGRHVAFESQAGNLAPEDANEGVSDVFVHDRVTGTTALASLGYSGQGGEAGSHCPTISGDGQVVAFSSGATDLVPGDDNFRNDVFVRDAVSGTTERVSVGAFGEQAQDHSECGSVSADGRYVAFSSSAPNLVGGDENMQGDAFLRDREAPLWLVPEGQTYGSCGTGIYAVNPSGCQADPVIGATGSFVTSATDLSLPGIGVPFAFTRSYTSADRTIGDLGEGWAHSYAASLTVQENDDVLFRGGDGQQVLFVPAGDGTYSSPPGGRSTLVQAGQGYELTLHDQVVHRFDDQGRLIDVLDRSGQGVALSYGEGGNLASLTDSVGRVIAFTHSGGHLEQVELPDGRSVTYGYTEGRLTSVTDVRGGTITYSYDEGGRLTEITDANGHPVIRNVYGTDGRVTEQVDPLDNESTFSWDPETETSTMTDARGNEWKDVYSGNVLIRRIDPLGNATWFHYDADLNLTHVTDPRGNTTRLSYDDRGNLLERTAPSPLSYQESFTYDAQNNLITSTDGRGNTTTYEYDSSGNLVEITQPEDVVTGFGRDPGTGLLTSVTDPRGKTTTFAHDAQGNLTEVTSPSGDLTTMGYDSSGRMISMVEARGNEPGANSADYTWAFTHDNADHLLTQTDPLGNQTQWIYDPVGNLESVQDANDHLTEYGYNAADELTSVTAPDDSLTSYDYDEVGNLTARTDAMNHVTDYQYDDARRLIGVESPIGQHWAYEYDPSGNIKNVTTARGMATPAPGDGTISYSYDELNRLTGIDYSDATPDVGLAWDANGNRTEMTDGSGTVGYAWDSLNRLTSLTRGADTFSYAYDPSGNVTQRTYPDATVVDYTYTDDGQLATVVTGGTATSYGYDPAGNLVQTTLPSGNGHVETRTYDQAGRITEVKNAKGGTVLSKFTYTLDAVGNPTQVVSQASATTYQYDDRDRIIEACFQASCPLPSDPFIRWAYDDVGNRTSETRPAGITAYVYNDADQLTSLNGPSGTANYTYDDDGNQTAAGPRTFAYDQANRLTSTTSGSATVTYTYDGDGRRLQASTGTQASQKTKYLWDPNWPLFQLALERNGAGTLRRRYIHGNDLISMFTGGKAYYYHYDALGSTANLTSNTGAKQWTYAYEPFGGIRTETKNNTSAPVNLMRFTGELLDTDTGLYHLRARQYDSNTARFLAVDPLPPSAGRPCVSSYAFVENLPTRLIDPTGLRGCTVDRSGFGPGAYWDIRSHMEFWDEFAQDGVENPNAVVGFFQWIGGNAMEGVLDVSGLDTVQGSAETLATPCTSPGEKIASVASIVGVGAQWMGSYWASVGREFTIGKNLRIAPFGNRGPGRIQLPHYHRRVIGPGGNTIPGQGIGWHRPWEKGW